VASIPQVPDPKGIAVRAATTGVGTGPGGTVNSAALFRWHQIWPVLADAFNLPLAPPLPMSLVDVMADKEPVWEAMIARHGLAPTPFEQVSSWAFGDFVFPGTTTCSPTPARPVASDSIPTSTRGPCCSTGSTSCANAGSSRASPPRDDPRPR
jgi:hypothetical protein